MDLLNLKDYDYYRNQIAFYQEAQKTLIKEIIQTEEYEKFFVNRYLTKSDMLYILHSFMIYNKYLKTDRYVLADTGYYETNRYVDVDHDDFATEYGEKYKDMFEDFLDELEQNLCTFEYYSQSIKVPYGMSDTSFMCIEMFSEDIEYLDDYAYCNQYFINTEYDYALPILSDIISKNRKHINEVLEVLLKEYEDENNKNDSED